MATCTVNGGPYQRAATLQPTRRLRGLTQNSRAANPKRKRPNCHKKENSRNSVGGISRPQCAKGKGPEDAGVAAPLPGASCRGNCWYAGKVFSVTSRWTTPSCFPTTSAHDLQPLILTIRLEQKTVKVPIFCSSLTRIVYVPKSLQRPVPSSFLKECYFRKCSTSSKWSISPSRCGDHRQDFGRDWRIYHVLPPHGTEYDQILPSLPQEMLLFSPRGKIALSRSFPSVSAWTLESAFFPGFFTD